MEDMLKALWQIGRQQSEWLSSKHKIRTEADNEKPYRPTSCWGKNNRWIKHYIHIHIRRGYSVHSILYWIGARGLSSDNVFLVKGPSLAVFHKLPNPTEPICWYFHYSCTTLHIIDISCASTHILPPWMFTFHSQKSIRKTKPRVLETWVSSKTQELRGDICITWQLERKHPGTFCFTSTCIKYVKIKCICICTVYAYNINNMKNKYRKH